MQTFYMIIKKENLSLYEKSENAYKKVYLEGNPEYSYSISNAKEYLDRFTKMILEEYNLDTVGEINFIVIDNEDMIISDTIIKVLGNSIKKQIHIETLIGEVLKNLNRDRSLYIEDLGINFDGKKYIIKNQEIIKDEFSLLAYSISDDMLMKFVG